MRSTEEAFAGFRRNFTPTRFIALSRKRLLRISSIPGLEVVIKVIWGLIPKVVLPSPGLESYSFLGWIERSYDFTFFKNHGLNVLKLSVLMDLDSALP
ncbi:hypothetical protein VNO77_20240 [Canavalia gladiata]|uniref:Uncharacterized protein n=1 Tax=Canavalia gladiata TaxID=3824 RepID=A0AAN9LNV5_CANGL